MGHLDLYDPLDVPTDEEVLRAILSVPLHFVFTPRSSKNCPVRYNAIAVTAKKWTVTPKVGSSADVTNFEGATILGPDATAILVEQKLACTINLAFTIELDADATANLYDAGIVPGNSNKVLKLYLAGTAGTVFWQFPTPYFDSVPNTADVKAAIGHTITGEGSGSFLYPTGAF